MLKQLEQLTQTQDSLSALRSEVQNIKPTIVYKTEILRAPEIQKELDVASAVSHWKNRVAVIVCEFQYANGSVYQTSMGSAVVVEAAIMGTIALTNRHVIVNSKDGKEYTPSWCTAEIAGVGTIRVDLIKGFPVPMSTPQDDSDWGYLQLDMATQQNGKGLFKSLPTMNDICSNANIGDKVVILGYPSIGARTGITATEGIVSGVENEYFVTSAKIDHGNSGGLAVLLKDNCFLGIPSWAKSGEIESLGRILSAKYIYTSPR